MHLSLARLVSMPVIFCLLPISSIVILVFYLFSTGISEQHVWEQSTGLTLPLRVTPMNNLITLITSTVAGLHFCCVICVALQISEQFFFRKPETPTHCMSSWNQILTQNDNSGSFKVIRFGVNKEPLRGNIVQYNKCGLKYEGSEDIASERSENRHLRPPHSHLTPPLQRTPANICINLIPPETTFPGLHFCRWQYMGSSASFRTVLSESRRRQPISCRARNRF